MIIDIELLISSNNLVGKITHPILASFFFVIYQKPGFVIYLGVSLLCEQLNICHLFFTQVMLWAALLLIYYWWPLYNVQFGTSSVKVVFHLMLN